MQKLVLMVLAMFVMSGCGTLSDITPSSLSSLVSSKPSEAKPVQASESKSQSKSFKRDLKPSENAAATKQICNGKKSDAKSLLVEYVNKKPEGIYKDFKLADVSVCEEEGVEEALFVRGDESIKVRLDRDDTEGGVINVLNLKHYQGGDTKAKKGIKWWILGSHYVDYYQGIVIETNVAYLDYIINDKTSLSISRHLTDNEEGLDTIDIYGNIDIGGIIGNFETKDNWHKASSQDSSNERSTTDSALNKLKSFF
jgi:hypothetical protein